MNSISDLQQTLRDLDEESIKTKDTISTVLLTVPFDWPHIHQSLYEFIVPTDIIDQVLGELRKLERTSSYIYI
jgi:hypothetical protein